MTVDRIEHIRKDIIIVRLKPKATLTDCFCQFIPGQYVEVWIPDTEWLSRAYSISNSPREDGSIDLQIRRQEGGRFTTWAFDKMEIGAEISVRGPLGNFTLFSERETSIIFIAGGTGFAPIKSMIEQLIKIGMTRENVILFWGAHDSDGFYDLDLIDSWIKENNNLKCILATNNILEGFNPPNGIEIVKDSLVNALQNSSSNLTRFDAYIAGPPSMMPSVLKCITSKGIKHERIKVDSFGG